MAVHAVSRRTEGLRTWYVVDQGLAPANQTIEQRAFAHVWAPENHAAEFMCSSGAVLGRGGEGRNEADGCAQVKERGFEACWAAQQKETTRHLPAFEPLQ